VALKNMLVHGGNVHAAARDLRRPIESILDFSASINPLGPSPQVIRALVEAAPLVQHYPDPDCFSLKQVIARRWKISSDRLVIGSGSSELIDVIPRALCIRSALIVGPTYGEYARAVDRAGGRSRMVLASRKEEYRPPLQRITHRVESQRSGATAIDAVFICHPNSPTGRPGDLQQLDEFFQAADHAGIWVVLDESFIDYCEVLTCMPRLQTYPRLIILRSFTKFYGMPGLRIGYSMSSRSVAAMLRAHQPPWSVNTVAQRAAEAAIADELHARRCLAYVEKERARVAKQLAALAGVAVIPSSTNFVFVELPPSCRAGRIARALRRRGILIRDCSSVEGCTPRSIRIAVRTKAENDSLLAALAHLLKG
jgi:threonine-phosphate decarboxylase